MHGSLSSDLQALGYENDEMWRSQLSGVDPELNSSHYDEFVTSEEVSALKRGRYREAFKRVVEVLLQRRFAQR
jgi:hypothetical protein